MAEEETGDVIYRNDSLRLCSFRNWPNSNISRESLAVAGFYYIDGVQGEPGDKVRCAWCSGELENWVSGDCAITEHLRHFPHCQFAKELADKNRINIIRPCGVQDGLSGLVIDQHLDELKSLYTSFEARLESFGTWPRNNPQKPDALATAGFYYIGRDDEVRCFYCNLGLSKWMPTDDPWVEHAKYRPNCNFLVIQKGKTFIENPTNESSSNNVNRNETVRNMNAVTDADVENLMGSSCAVMALRCGLQPDRIKKAIRARLIRTGLPFDSAENLIDAALNEQINETSFSIPESTPAHHASSSSTDLSINDAAFDLFTRMIINSALMGDQDLSNTLSAGFRELGIPIAQDIDNTAEEDTEAIQESNDAECDVSNDINPTNQTASVSDVTCIPPESSLTLEEENKLLKDARLCKICMDSEVCIVFLPCGHLVSCSSCATKLAQCPICRDIVKGFIRTYLS